MRTPRRAATEQRRVRSPMRHACRSVATPTPNFSTWPGNRDKRRATSTCYLLTNRMIDSWTRHRTWTSLSKSPPLIHSAVPSTKPQNKWLQSFKLKLWNIICTRIVLNISAFIFFSNNLLYLLKFFNHLFWEKINKQG